jgi:N-acetylglucosaminyldiphosphoundecaprenol N-acetyl-beta-D-mannosaminyltransferase
MKISKILTLQSEKFKTFVIDLIDKELDLTMSHMSSKFDSKDSVKILNVQINNTSMQEMLTNLEHGIVLTPNVDHLMRLQHDVDFFHIYKSADYRVCDSQILLYASRFLGTPLQEKISGSDFFPAFYEFHADNEDIRIFLLGGLEGVPDKAAAAINKKIDREIIVDFYSPPLGFESDEQECLAIVERISRSGATVLAVAVGAPKQEKWIYRYKRYLPTIKIFMAIGATVDFEAGVISRAPSWVSRLGIEWLYRLMSEPNRLWKRYFIDDLPFFYLLLKQRFSLYKNPLTLSGQDRQDPTGM